ncbi:hypothetical protein KFL_000100610 [Klebsormidium nitens]|uniref:Uncharacterized protein n=1 Tax=Klebsormidium nitens TaxID=105231 RepID=A0A1Y1HNV8_KLENI|nr:hypothetical protein KFL_000100610 [Klebsormidium nitens]|eukprot:GAQ78296.1 hypothetical protein KFL_000100610 [Klebsormidium nitens]
MLTGASLLVGRGFLGAFALPTTSSWKARLAAEKSSPFSNPSFIRRTAHQLSVGAFVAPTRRGSLALSACTASLALLVCAFFPAVKPAAATLNYAIAVQGLASLLAYFSAEYTLLAFEKDSRMSGQLLERDPALPPDWHTLFDRKTNRVYFYNSQLGGILQALVTVGLYWSTVATLFWCTSAVYGAKQLGMGTSFFLAAAFLALPQPLPLVVLALSLRPSVIGGTLAARFESALCVTLLISVLSGLCSTLATIDRAAKARLPSCRLPWNCACFSRLLVALCPALSWRLHPYALRLDYARVALLPLLSRVPLQAPVPRWELLTFSWRALLYAAPMVLPLARLLAAAAAANPQGLAPGTLYGLVLHSRPVQMSACVSVVGFLFDRQRKAYEVALEEKKKELERAEVENLDKKLLADFDRMLVEVKD